jgi:hypothetical protein
MITSLIAQLLRRVELIEAVAKKVSGAVLRTMARNSKCVRSRNAVGEAGERCIGSSAR